MAKKTKDSTLSIEERLEQALIPNWDEPYKLPPNWCWTKLSSISAFERGITFPASAKESLSLTTNIPCLRTANVQESLELHDLLYVDRSYMKDNSDKLVRENDIIMSTANSRELVGKTSFVHSLPEEMTFGGFIMAIRSKINPKYLFYFLRLQFLNGKFMGNSTQTTNIANINSTALGETETPIPPLTEQERIVSRIESLFAKLDEAKEKAQEVVDGFETCKAAILHKAFSGELTAKWREENDVDISNYVKRRFDEVAIIKSNLVDPAEYQNYPHIAPDNIEKKTGVLLEYHTIAEDGVKSGKHRFYPGQILYSKIRPNLSKAVVVDFDGLCSADMYPIEAIGDAKCLWYFMLSENFLEQASSAGSRSVLPKINQKELSALTVTIPDSLEEQKEIANIIDSLFAKEYQVKETAEAVIEQIATMKKAILARAFRGELGTNDPSEESAVELLKKVLSGGEN